MRALEEFEKKLKDLQAQRQVDAVELANCILSAGIELGASDIHIEPQADSMAVRFRLNGVLYDAGTLDRVIQSQLISRIKVLSDLLTYKTDLPQDGPRSLHNGRMAILLVSVGEVQDK